MSNVAEIIKFPTNTEQTGGRMVDLSNGYTKTANEIQKLKPRLRMSGREWQCFEAVIWLTYGWNKKSDRVTNTVIAELTGLDDTHVSNALRSLSERKIIRCHKQGVMKLVGVNTELSAWILDKPKTVKLLPKTVKPLPETVKGLPETVDTQDYNNNKLKRSSSENSGESSDDRLEKFLLAHPDAAIYTPSGAKWGSAEDLQCAEWIFERVKTTNPTSKEPNWKDWANTLRLMREIDGRTHREIAKLFQLANRNSFWFKNILCPSKLRSKWDELTLKLGDQQHANNSGESDAVQRIRAERKLWERERRESNLGALGVDGADLREPLDSEKWEQTNPALDNPNCEHDRYSDNECL